MATALKDQVVIFTFSDTSSSFNNHIVPCSTWMKHVWSNYWNGKYTSKMWLKTFNLSELNLFALLLTNAMPIVIYRLKQKNKNAVPLKCTRKKNAVTNTDTCGDWLMFVLHCLNWRMVNLPVAILRRSLPHGEHLGKAQQRESIALTITTFPPHGSLSVVDPRLSGHIIVFKMHVLDPIKHKSHFLSISLYSLYPEEKHDIGLYMGTGTRRLITTMK